jgi:uncharacterized protein YecE (DUF72 family)
MSPKQGTLHIGISGYQYAHWRGVFYPEGIPKRRWFAHYAAHFDTEEIHTFYYQRRRGLTAAQAPAMARPPSKIRTADF